MSDVIGAVQPAAAPESPSPIDGDDIPIGTAALPSPPPRLLRGIILYCLIAFVLCWIACLPLWMGPGLSDAGLVAICGGIAMFTPAISAILVARLVERRRWRRKKSESNAAAEEDGTGRGTVFASLGLRVSGGARRFIPAMAVGMVSPVALLLASQLLAGAFGTYDLDLTLRQVVTDLRLPADAPLAQVWLSFGGRLATAMVLGGAINLVLALGEELGWRGYLMPRIQQLWGLPTAIIAGGIIWGLWHAPLILLGYNYPDAAPWIGQFAMIAACTGVGGFLYLLTVHFGSLWPAALAHGVNNAVSGIVMGSLLVPGMKIDTVNGSALGWPGWIVYGTVVVVGFALLRRRGHRRGPRTSRTTYRLGR